MLSNRAYIRKAVHKGESYPVEHDAIIDRGLWGKEHDPERKSLCEGTSHEDSDVCTSGGRRL